MWLLIQKKNKTVTLHPITNIVTCITTEKLEYRDLVRGKTKRVKKRYVQKNQTIITRILRTRGNKHDIFIHWSKISVRRKEKYVQTVCDICTQKIEIQLVRLPEGLKLIKYPGDVITPKAGIKMIKYHWNNIVSYKRPQYMLMDAEYTKRLHEKIRICQFRNLKTIPDAFFIQYNLGQYTYRGYVCAEIRKVMYGLPQARIILHYQLVEVLEPFGYAPISVRSGMCHHKVLLIIFTSVVDNFRIKYTGKIIPNTSSTTYVGNKK